MPTYPIRELEKFIQRFYIESKLQKPFYSFMNLPPLKILRISNAFPKLNLAQEEILLCFDNASQGNFTGFLLTSQNFYWTKQKTTRVCSLTNVAKEVSAKNLEEVLGEEYRHYTKIFNSLLQIISSGDLKPVKPNEGESEKRAPLVISEEQVAAVVYEGDQLKTIMVLLEGDTDLSDAIQKALGKMGELKHEFKPVHIVLQDIISIFNQVATGDSGEISIQQKFILAYIFEKIQGNDLASMLSVERINEMVHAEKFNEGIEKIRSAKYLAPPEEYKEQLIMPSLLFRMSHPQHQPLAVVYNRIAALVANADSKISAKENEVLAGITKLTLTPEKKIQAVKQTAVPSGDSLEKVLGEMNELVGMKNVKQDVNDLINFLKVQKLRREQGLADSARSLHSVFMGPPGTGKTTMARLVGRIYKHLGYLESGHIVETDRAGLVAGYVGQTALKVEEVVKSALNGVLFIDEAYSLSGEETQRDFGDEAIEALLKRMEDNRNKLVVIVAGYTGRMKEFVRSNPGLQSRFDRYFEFQHYTAQEMMQIFVGMAKKADFILSDDAKEKLQFIFDGLYEKRNETFGNARVVRNIFEQCVSLQANRIVNIHPLTKEVLMKLEETDVPEVKETVRKVFIFEEG